MYTKAIFLFDGKTTFRFQDILFFVTLFLLTSQISKCVTSSRPLVHIGGYSSDYAFKINTT